MAIHLKKPGYERLLDALEKASVVLVGAPMLLESALVLTARLGRDARPGLSAFLRGLHAEVVPVNEAHQDTAVTAFLRFGCGRHPASLNFGDCMSYAVAAVAGMPLLFTCGDFTQTDIACA